jgi:hypothetical protein
MITTARLGGRNQLTASLAIKGFIDVSESASHRMFPILVFMAILP